MPLSHVYWLSWKSCIFHSGDVFIVEKKKLLCISAVPMNDLKSMKNCPGGFQGRSN